MVATGVIPAHFYVLSKLQEFWPLYPAKWSKVGVGLRGSGFSGGDVQPGHQLLADGGEDAARQADVVLVQRQVIRRHLVGGSPSCRPECRVTPVLIFSPSTTR